MTPAATTDRECVEFLQWALPQLGLRWAGFRKVRRQVCRRLRRRLDALQLPGLDAYKSHLAAHPEEWELLAGLTPITISRFYRDREVCARLERDLLPELATAAVAGGRERVRCWSAGCASGEEAYTLSIVWHEVVARRVPGLALDILATDIEPAMLRRAHDATYGSSSVKELPQAWRELSFVHRQGRYALRPELRRRVTVARHDVRMPPPDRGFDLVLCRNVAFTYLGCEHQRTVLAHLAAATRDAGALVIGLHEALPRPAPWFEPWPDVRAVFRRSDRPPST